MTDPRVEAAVESIRAFPFWNFGMDDVNPSDEYAEWVPALATRMVAALAAADAVAPTVDRDTLVRLLETCGPGVAQEVVADVLIAAGVGGGDVGTTYPDCPDHREVQHRDAKPPWCPACGWNRGWPAIPPRQITTPKETR